jgi:hypothetical protein
MKEIEKPVEKGAMFAVVYCETCDKEIYRTAIVTKSFYTMQYPKARDWWAKHLDETAHNAGVHIVAN